ncbi:MAG: oligosaccharide flippase family protein [Ginsengibacter sp.]
MIEAKLTMNFYKRMNLFFRSSAFRSAGIYTFSSFLAKSVGFFLLFIYSNPLYISVDENGLLNLLTSSIFIFMPFLSLGIIHSTSVDFFKLSKSEFKDSFTSGLIIPAVAVGLGVLVLFLFRNQLKSAYGFPVSFVLVIPLLTLLFFITEQLLSLIRNNDEPVKYFKADFLRLIIEASLSIILVVSFGWRWKGRVAGIIVANLILCVVAFSYFKKKGYLFGKIKKKYIKAELLYGLPIIVMQCSIFCLLSSDKFFLSYFTDNTAVGIYSYACVFAAIITIICSAILNYVTPKIYKCLSEEMVDFNQILKYFIFYAGFGLLAVASILLVTPFLYRSFINSRYYPGLDYLYLILSGYFFWNLTAFFYSFFLFKKEKGKILVLSLISICISLGSNFFFIKLWGIKGAAISVCISYFIVLLITLIASHKEVGLMKSSLQSFLKRYHFF